MALNAFGMVIQEVAGAAKTGSSVATQSVKQLNAAQKAAAQTMARNRQAQSRAAAANRNRQVNASKQAQAAKTQAKQAIKNPNSGVTRSSVRNENRGVQNRQSKKQTALRGQHKEMQINVKKAVEKATRPEGKVNEASDVKWLNKYSGEAREAKEEELMQSLGEAGHYTFKGENGENMWIEKMEDDDDWSPDYGKATGDNYSSKAYGNLVNRNKHAGSVDDIDFDIFG